MKAALRIAIPMALGAALGAGGVLAIGALVPPKEPERAALVPDPPPVARPEPEPAPSPEVPAPVPEPQPPSPPPPPPAPPPTSASTALPPVAVFFGFAAETADAAPEPPPPEPPRPDPKPAAPSAPPKPPPVLRYVPLKDKCVAGFDATSTLHDFRGWTKDVSGRIRFEKDRLEATAEGEIVVDARTLDTGNKDRDQEMHQDFLETKAHPEMKFALVRFRRGDNEGSYVMKGTIEIHGKSREVEVPGTFELRADGYLHVKGEFKARMTDFGISPPVTAVILRVADEIKIWFELWARPERSKP